jgi:SOS-response transcriptional repressor LexA
VPSPASNLTDRQTELLDFIRSYTAEHGYSPSTRDIGDGMGIASPNGVLCHIRALIKKGALQKVIINGRALGRSFKIVGEDPTKRIVAAVEEKFGKRGRFFAAGVDVSQVVQFVLGFK